MELITDPAAIAHLTLQAQQRAGGGGSVLGNLPPADLQGPELQAWFDQNNRPAGSMIRSIINGDVSAKGRNLQQYLPWATLVDPSLHQFDYDTRLKTRQNYTPGGKGEAEVKAINTAIGHADQFYNLIDKLPNSNLFPGANPTLNAIRGQFPGDYQKLRGTVESKAEALAGEMAKMFNGGVSALADREHYRKILDVDQSPEKLKSALASLMDLAATRSDYHVDAYKGGMGRAAEGWSPIKPANQPVFERLRAGGYGETGGHNTAPPSATSPAASATQFAVNPQTGARIMFQNGRWVPAQ